MDKAKFHPPERDLQAFLDGELRSKRHVAKIEKHLASCWDCRARLAQTEGTITEFVTLRRKLLDARIQSTDFPPARASRALLGMRIGEIASASHQPVWSRIGLALWPVARIRRPVWITAFVAVFLAALLVIEPLVVPSVSAMEVIANGKAAEQQIHTGVILHQRVRIRHKPGNASVGAAVDCDLWKSGVRSRLLVASGRSDPADRLRAIYQARGADWETPLSVTSFAKLRDSLGEVRDEVRGRDEITVTSTPVRLGQDAAEVRRVELTVRRSDWHAISQRIELRDAEYELTELLAEAVARDRVDPGIFAEPVIAAAAPVVPAPRETSTVIAPVMPPSPTGEQLDNAEVQLREALHQTWADVQEVPEIQREGDRIRFRLFAETEQRKEEIQAALTGIPFVVPEITDPESGAPGARAGTESPGTPAVPQPSLHSTEPPLAKALREYSGGLDPANNYLNAVRDSYLAVLVDASALARLAERYSDPEWERLPSPSQERLNRIAADYVTTIRTNLDGYLKLVSPVLDEMLSRQQLSPNAAAAGESCASWRAEAGALVADLGELQKSFRRLFVEERTEQPIALSAAELLQQSVQSRSRLQARPLCQP